MKKLFKTIAMLAIAGSLFTSCSKDDDKTTSTTATAGTVQKPSLTLSVTNEVSLRYGDTIRFSLTTTPVTGTKIKTVLIARGVGNSPAKNLLTDSTLQSSVEYKRNFEDVIDNTIGNVGDNITYTVTVKDDKGNSETKTVNAKIIGFYKSGQFLLGGPNNPSNEFKFFGLVASAPQTILKLKAGAGSTPPSAADSASRARYNVGKLDIIYFYNSAGSVGNALYSSDFAFAAGSGWATEVSAWTAKRKTLLRKSQLSLSAFNAPDITVEGTLKALKTDFTVGGATVDRIANLAIGDVVEFKTADGKVGLVGIIQVSSNELTGQLTLEVKWIN
jgi:hypothetical protein